MTENLEIFYLKFHNKLNFVGQYSLFFPLYIIHNMSEPMADFGILLNIMFVKTANIISKICAK